MPPPDPCAVTTRKRPSLWRPPDPVLPSVTLDKWVLEMVNNGYSMAFLSLQPTHAPHPPTPSAGKINPLGGCRTSSAPTPQVRLLFQLFPHPKKEQWVETQSRLQNIQQQRFRMVTLATIIATLDPGD